jgi:type II secretory pathway predicted ATPase ExeA
VLLTNPTLTRAEFYDFLARGLGLSDEAAGSKSRFLLELQRNLEQRSEGDRPGAIIIDEAQSLSYELLEEIRLLTNIETETVKLFNVVLAGQPELAIVLNQPRLRQLKQRITLRCRLAALDLSETAAYVAGRLRCAGGAPESIFTRDAVARVFHASAGIPRTINVICDNALLGGFAAQVRPIDTAVVDDICRDFDLGAAVTDAGERANGNETQVPLARETTEVAAAAQPSEPGVAVNNGALLAAANPAAASNDLFSMFTRKRRFSFF